MARQYAHPVVPLQLKLRSMYIPSLSRQKKPARSQPINRIPQRLLPTLFNLANRLSRSPSESELFGFKSASLRSASVLLVFRAHRRQKDSHTLRFLRLFVVRCSGAGFGGVHWIDRSGGVVTEGGESHRHFVVEVRVDLYGCMGLSVRWRKVGGWYCPRKGREMERRQLDVTNIDFIFVRRGCKWETDVE